RQGRRAVRAGARVRHPDPLCRHRRAARRPARVRPRSLRRRTAARGAGRLGAGPRKHGLPAAATRPRTAAASMSQPSAYPPRLLAWFDRHGRHDLPWQHPRTPYRVWLSEIMLQQTQVAVVVPYFLRFVERFPTLPDLAAASTDEVMAHWAGLGYYARARNLHAAAKLCVAQHDGALPRGFEALHALPGIGRSTAGAILAQAWGERCAI